MATNFKPNASHFIFLFIGILVGVLTYRYLFCGGGDSFVNCGEHLIAARDSLGKTQDTLNMTRDTLGRAYVISTGGPTRDLISPQEANLFRQNFEASNLDIIGPYKGMNIHKDHLDQMVQYHLDLKATNTRYAGFRIYNCLETTPTGNPTVANVRHLIVPLAANGNVLSNINVYKFDPADRFELPCPTLCDISGAIGN